MLKTLLQHSPQGCQQSAAQRIWQCGRKIAHSAIAAAVAPAFLFPVDRVGLGSRSFGRPWLDNAGQIDIGRAFVVNNRFCPVELATTASGRIQMGQHVSVNFGCKIIARSQIRLGHRVGMGPYCILADNEHAGIDIGDDVWLAGRVVVLPGARIGARAVISSGSVVVGEIPPDAVASGVPAKVLRIRGNTDRDAGGGRSKSGPLPPAEAAALSQQLAALRQECDRRDAYWFANKNDNRRQKWFAVAEDLLPKRFVHGPSRVGQGWSLHGRPWIENRGEMNLGDAVQVTSRPVQSHFCIAESGRLHIGSRVRIDQGAAVSVHDTVTIGDDVLLGEFVMILDFSYHGVNDRDVPEKPMPIAIANGVRLGKRVTVLRGVTIGEGTVVLDDSVVSRSLPAHVTASGVPARPIRA